MYNYPFYQNQCTPCSGQYEYYNSPDYNRISRYLNRFDGFGREVGPIAIQRDRGVVNLTLSNQHSYPREKIVAGGNGIDPTSCNYLSNSLYGYGTQTMVLNPTILTSRLGAYRHIYPGEPFLATGVDPVSAANVVTSQDLFLSGLPYNNPINAAVKTKYTNRYYGVSNLNTLHRVGKRNYAPSSYSLVGRRRVI